MGQEMTRDDIGMEAWRLGGEGRPRSALGEGLCARCWNIISARGIPLYQYERKGVKRRIASRSFNTMYPPHPLSYIILLLLVSKKEAKERALRGTRSPKILEDNIRQYRTGKSRIFPNIGTFAARYCPIFDAAFSGLEGQRTWT